MTLILEALEQGVQTIRQARQEVGWVSDHNPVWLTLWHAEQYVAREFKAEFNRYFKGEDHDE